MALDVLLNDVDEIERGLLCVVHARLLLGELLFEVVALRAERCFRAGYDGCAAGLGFCDHPVTLCLRLRHLLLHGSLLAAIFLELFDQNLHLGLQHGIFFVEHDVVFGERFEKIVHLLHIIAAEDGLGEGLLLNFLGCEHTGSPFRPDAYRYRPLFSSSSIRSPTISTL